MSSPNPSQPIDTAIRLALLAGLGYFCLTLFRPFLMPVAWAAIIAVAIYPLLVRLERALGRTGALAVFTLGALALILVPVVLLAASMVEAVQGLHAQYEAGSLSVPPPPAGVADWPIIGERLDALWTGAATNLQATLERFPQQLAAVAGWLLSAAAGAGGAVLQSILAILIAAAFVAKADAAGDVARRLGTRLAGDDGAEFAELATATTRSVAQGVLGVAIIQSLLAGMGMLAVGVPAAGLWAMLVLVLAVVQLPPLLVLAPAILWVFGNVDTVPAVLFAIWGLLVSVSDTFLKPLFLGRGMDIPMLVILLGAIGGMLMSGVIGLFVGAIGLALAYTLFTAWVDEADVAVAASPAEEA